MFLRPLTNGSVTGAGLLSVPSGLLGPPLITADGTNAAVLTLHNDSPTGYKFFQYSNKTPMPASMPIICSTTIYYNLSGTGAAVQFFECVI